MKKLIIALLILITPYSGSFAANYHGMGRNAYVYRNFDKAREYFLLDVKDNPNRGDSYYFLGELEKTLKNYDESLRYFQIAVTKNTTRKYLINAYWNMIILFEEKGDYNNLVKYCRELWFRTGDGSAKQKIESIVNKILWTDNEQAIAKYNQAVELSKKGDNTGALQLYRECLSIDSNFLAPRFEIGMKAYNAGNENEALSQLNYIGEKIPFYAEVHLILGGINFKNRNYNAAAENYTSVINFGFIDKKTEYNATLKRGTCYYQTGRFDEAEKDITASIDYFKNDSEPLIMLSAIYIKKKNFEAALKILGRAESISGTNPVVLFQTGSIYYFQNDSKYVSYFDRLYDITKSDDNGIKQYLRAFTLLLNNHFENKKYARALEISESVNKIQKDTDVITISAKSSYNLQQYEKAVSLFEQIPLNSNTRLMLASAYARTQNKEKSMALLRSIINDPSIRTEAMKNPSLKPYIEEMERSKNDELKRQQQELQRQQELKRQQELELQKQQELKRQQDLELQKQQELKKQQDLELQKQQELEKQNNLNNTESKESTNADN